MLNLTATRPTTLPHPHVGAGVLKCVNRSHFHFAQDQKKRKKDGEDRGGCLLSIQRRASLCIQSVFQRYVLRVFDRHVIARNGQERTLAVALET
jgi:hypothetical protein